MRTKGSECKSQVLTPQSDSQKKRKRAVDRAAQELQDKLRKMEIMQREVGQTRQLVTRRDVKTIWGSSEKSIILCLL